MHIIFFNVVQEKGIGEREILFIQILQEVKGGRGLEGGRFKTLVQIPGLSWT